MWKPTIIILTAVVSMRTLRMSHSDGMADVRISNRFGVRCKRWDIPTPIVRYEPTSNHFVVG